MSLDTLPKLRQAIGAGDSAYLTKVSGIGKKTAEKIIIELRDKMEEFADDYQINQSDSDVVDALEALGYSVSQARGALKQVDNELDIQAKIKAVLKIVNS